MSCVASLAMAWTPADRRPDRIRGRRALTAGNISRS
jgi:hypothetical protein